MPAVRLSRRERLKLAMQVLVKHNFLCWFAWEAGMAVGNHHKAWWRNLKTGEDCVFLSPRDHGKSLAIARSYPIWKAKYHVACSNWPVASSKSDHGWHFE